MRNVNSPTPSQRTNTQAAALRKDEDREQISIGILSLPAILLIFVGLILPCGWLFFLSFVGKSGDFSLENYERLINSSSYFRIFLITFEISLLTTFICGILGYPVAYFITRLPKRAVAFAMLAVILPFWTSLLVRTYAWLVLLQKKGVINTMLVKAGVIDTPLTLVHNYTGTVIGMTHIMLPLLVLPLYTAMKTINPDYIRAAANLGAGPAVRFWTVYFPLSLPGLGAGALLVFVLSLGFYVTPAILGGGKVIMAAMRIQSSVALYSNWGAASAIAVVLLLITTGFLVVGLWVGRFRRIQGGL